MAMNRFVSLFSSSSFIKQLRGSSYIPTGTLSFYFPLFYSFSSSLQPFHYHSNDDRQLIIQSALQQFELGFTEIDDAISLFFQLKSLYPPPSLVVFTQLFNAMMKMKPSPPYSAVLSLSRELHLSIHRPDLYTLTIIVNCFCRLGNVALAFSTLAIVFKLGHQADIVLYNSLLNGLIISYRFHEVDSFLDKVLHLGFQPTVVTYNTLMHGMCTLGLWTNAKEMFKEMLINNITPDVYTMNILINAFVKCKDFDKALGVIQEMSLKGLTPNIITYNIMIDALCKENKLAFANHLTEVMKAYGLKPDVVTWSSLLHGLCENGQLDEAMGLIAKMENEGVSPNIVTYSILIDGLCEVGQLRKAVDVFLSLPSKRLKPNLHTYTIMIKGLCKGGLFDDACELFKTMEDDGYTADAYAINTLIIEFLNRNYPSKASGVVKCRNDIQFKANVTSLFQGLLNRDDVSYTQKEMIVQILRSKQLRNTI